MIGVFDSGLGGLTIFKGLIKKLPKYQYIYLGDNARVPYGTRSFDVIYEYTKQAVDYLFKKGCVLIIVACNTASAVALRKIQKEYLPKYYPKNRVLGVLIPAAEEAVSRSGLKRIGVIGTEATIKSNTLESEIKKLNPKASVYQQACPLLVPIIEDGDLKWPGLRLILKKYLRPLKARRIDTLVLGCTHYSIIKKPIKKIIGSRIRLISEDNVVPKKLRDYLRRHPEIKKRIKKGRKRDYYTTAYSQRFNKIAKMFMRKNVHFRAISLI